MKKMVKKILSLCMAVVMVAGMTTTAFAAENVIVKDNSDILYTIPGVISTETIPVDMDSVINSTTMGVSWIFRYATDKGVTVYTVPVGTNIDISGLDSCFVADVHLKDGVLKYVDNSGFGLVEALDFNFEFTTDEKGNPVFNKDAHVKFLKEGYYAFDAYRYVLSETTGNCVIHVVKEGTEVKTPDVKNTTISANSTKSKVVVNGAAIDFEAYTINGNNYFKLRDVAKVVAGSDKQFEVTWDGSKNAINLISGQAYTVVGGELAKGDGTAKNAVAGNSTIYKDGTVISLTAYTINGNNYFKLRDLGQAFDFGVSWDGQNNTVVIDTTQGYTE